MCIGIGGRGSIKGIENESVVVMIAYGICDNAPVVQVKNCAQIYLADFRPNVIFEFRHVRQPFQIRCVRMKQALQIVLGYVFRRCRRPGAAVSFVLNCGLDMKSTVDTKDAFIIYMDVVVPVQLVTYSPVPHVWMCIMDFPNLTGDSFVLKFMAALGVFQPFVIC